jgi:hypothetical protein
VCRVLGKTGENKAARAKAMSSAGVAEPIIASAEWPVRLEMGGGRWKRKVPQESKRNLKAPVKTRTLHLSEPYDSRSTPHTAMQPRKE